MEDMVLFAGSSNPVLADGIVEALITGYSIDGPIRGESRVDRFADGEVRIQLHTNVRKKDVFIIQSTNPPAENWDELIFMIDAARRASAREITAVIPYHGYMRQERKDEPRVSISMKIKMDQVVAAGADRILTCDLHAAASQGFVNIPVDNLYAAPALFRSLKERFDPPLKSSALVTDLGYSKIAGALAKSMGLDLVIARKVRRPNLVEEIDLIGDLAENAIFIDDIIDTGGTLRQIVRRLKAKGVIRVFAMATHPVLSPGHPTGRYAGSTENLNGAGLDGLLVTDTIRPPDDGYSRFTFPVQVCGMAELFASAIHQIFTGGSVSTIFQNQLSAL